MNKKYREESDSMGSMQIPSESLWGAQTQRAVENFSVSPLRMPESFLHALSLIKTAAAEANGKLDLIDDKIKEAIVLAAKKIREDNLLEEFPIDIFQTGSATSWNMNINEVISNMANLSLGYEIGNKFPIHPNDHVNRGQSSNDVIPSALNISNRLELIPLVEALKGLKKELIVKSEEFKETLKLGRTHLQDAVPMTLGQEFKAYAFQIKNAIRRIESTYSTLEELPLGGTAIGTGLNTHKDFAELTTGFLSQLTGIHFVSCPCLFEGIAARDAQLEVMGALNSLSSSLMKIAQDLRLLSSGPRSGLGEINLPSLQPGSSIMPGKINPVIPEMVIQTAAFVAGKYTSVTIACQNSPLELSIMQPLLAHETLTSIGLLTNVVKSLQTKCIKGITANKQKCMEYIEWSLALTTPLALRIGYDEAARIAKKAYQEVKTVREILEDEGSLSPEEIQSVLDPRSMI